MAAYPDGDLIVVWENLGLSRINRQSEVQWSVLNWAHHDVTLDEAGNVYTLVKEMREVNVRDTSVTVADEMIVKYGPDGERKAAYSLWNAITDSKFYGLNQFAILQYRAGGNRKDIYHTNGVEVIPGAHRDAFNGGDLLVSPLKLESILAIDTETRQVTWALTGRTSRIHDPTVTSSGNLLFFENGWLIEQSIVKEIDPGTKKLVWSYQEEGFLSPCCGTAQRLPNGLTLITSTAEGRAFQVDADGRIVWQFINPFRARNDREKIAAVNEMRNYSETYFSFLKSRD